MISKERPITLQKRFTMSVGEVAGNKREGPACELRYVVYIYLLCRVG